jgi:preprotein translocase SecE subunit
MAGDNQTDSNSGNEAPVQTSETTNVVVTEAMGGALVAADESSGWGTGQSGAAGQEGAGGGGGKDPSGGKGADKSSGAGKGGSAGKGSGGGKNDPGKGKDKAKGENQLQTLVLFLGEVWVEFKKITWPTRDQVFRETMSVLILVALLTLMVLAFDWVLAQGFFQPIESWARNHGGGIGRGY